MTTIADEQRWREVSAEHGTAALRHTHWLDATPRALEGSPGVWWAGDGMVHGRGLGEGEIALAPFQQVRAGRLLLRAFARDGALALRVYDPDNPSRLALRGIASYPYDDAWVIAGRFVPAADGARRTVRSVDGHETAVSATGSVALELDGVPAQLTVSGDAGRGLSAVIADGTAGDDAYPFRFLPLDAPDADGRVTVDFNRAYLPPCAFSDQYVCPLPPPENRLPVAITAGERRALRD